MVTPDTSDGSRSGVNWMRRHAPATLAAMARASVVLPTPGTSSTSMCPGANNAVTASRTRSGLPSTTEPIEAVSRAAVSVETPTSSGVSGSAGVIAAAPGGGWLLEGGGYWTGQHGGSWLMLSPPSRRNQANGM